MKSPRKKGPTQQVWLAATKDFRLVEPDIFTTDIGLGLPPSPSPIQEDALPRKRKAKDQGKEPVKRRRQARKAIEPVVLELDELPVIQSRSGRVIQRTNKAKASN